MPGTSSTTACMSSRVMKSGVDVLSGPETLPPEYCISTLFGPIFEISLRAYSLPVSPTVTTSTIEAEPITMPSIVRRNRTFEARKLSTASVIVSRKASEERALASVASKVLERREAVSAPARASW